MRQRLLALLALLLALTALLPAGPAITDEVVYLTMAQNLQRDGRFFANPGEAEMFRRFPPAYPVILAGYGLLTAPLAALGEMLPPAMGRLAGTALPLGFNVLVAGLIFWLLDRHFIHAPWLALCFVLASMLTVYSGTLFSEPLQALLLLAAFLALRRRQHMLLAVMLGLLMLVKPVNGIYCLLFSMLAGQDRKEWLRRGGLLIAVMLAVTAVHLLSNRVLRGEMLDFGYRPMYRDIVNRSWVAQEFTLAILPRGLYGFILSSGKSIFAYNPILLLGVYGLWRGWRRGDQDARRAALLAGATLLLYAAWSGWEGGVCFGPRFLLPAVPLICYGLGLLDFSRRAKPGLRALAIILVNAGLLINLGGAAVSYGAVYAQTPDYGTGYGFSLRHNFIADLLAAVPAALDRPHFGSLAIRSLLPPVAVLLFLVLMVNALLCWQLTRRPPVDRADGVR